MRNVTDTQYPYVINNPSYDTDTWLAQAHSLELHTYIYFVAYKLIEYVCVEPTSNLNK